MGRAVPRRKGREGVKNALATHVVVIGTPPTNLSADAVQYSPTTMP